VTRNNLKITLNSHLFCK